MGGGGHSTSSKTVNNIVNESINNVHNNEKNIDNYMQEHNIVTDAQYGDRALGSSVKIFDDANAGAAYYKLLNLNQVQLQNLNPVATTFWTLVGGRVGYIIYDDYIREPKDKPAEVYLLDHKGLPYELNERYRL